MWFPRLLYGMLVWSWHGLMCFCTVIMQVDSASMHRTAPHYNADAKGIVSISEQDVRAIYAQLAKVQEENLQLRRRLDVLEELSHG